MATASRHKMIQDVIDQRLAPATTATNHDVYDKRLTATNPWPGFYTPRCIYFYYIRIDRNGKIRVDHYLYTERDSSNNPVPIPHADVPRILHDLALNGRPKTKKKNPPKLLQNNFNGLWEYRCYVALFVDEANWALHKRDDGKSAVVFDPVAGVPNSSCFDAADFTLTLLNSQGKMDDRTGVYFINHVKNEDGEDLEVDRTLTFKFDMWFDAQFANSSTVGLTAIFDPGGTNQGPPVDPP